jgi:FkbM family methyltransferase
MQVAAVAPDGCELHLECPTSLAAAWTNRSILEGRTYPAIPFLEPVTTIFDVGANCGATSLFLAHHFPGATIHAFEPGRAAHELASANLAHLPTVTVHHLGLHSSNQRAELAVPEDLNGSVLKRSSTDTIEVVELRSARDWVREQAIDAIDILKVDVEGCELAVLESLEPWLVRVQVVYVEYESRQDRRAIDALLAPSHELYLVHGILDQGECTYVRADLLDDEPAVLTHLGEIVAADLRARAGGGQ